MAVVGVIAFKRKYDVIISNKGRPKSSINGIKVYALEMCINNPSCFFYSILSSNDFILIKYKKKLFSFRQNSILDAPVRGR